MRCLKFCFVTALVVFLGIAHAETIPPMKLDAPLDSLMYSTTGWSEPVNGLQMRVTYPMEVEFAEDCDVTLELMPVCSGEDATYTVCMLPESCKFMLTDLGGWRHRTELLAKLPDSLILGCRRSERNVLPNESTNLKLEFALAKVNVVHPVYVYPGGSKQYQETAIDVEAPPGGKYSADLTLVLADPYQQGNTTYVVHLDNILIRPEIYVARRLTVIAPKAVTLGPDCSIVPLFDTTVVGCQVGRPLGQTTIDAAVCDNFGTPRDLVKDTVRFKWPDSLRSIRRVLRSRLPEPALKEVLALFYLFQTIDPPGHLWPAGASGQRGIFFRAVKLEWTPEEMSRADSCLASSGEPLPKKSEKQERLHD